MNGSKRKGALENGLELNPVFKGINRLEILNGIQGVLTSEHDRSTVCKSLSHLARYLFTMLSISFLGRNYSLYKPTYFLLLLFWGFSPKRSPLLSYKKLSVYAHIGTYMYA